MALQSFDFDLTCRMFS